MHYSLAIALRYLRARRRSGFVSRVTMIAVGGTLVGVSVLIIVLSLMNGFENELRDRIVEFNTHVIVFASVPESWSMIDSTAALVGEVPGVVAVSPFVRGEALLYYELIRTILESGYQRAEMVQIADTTSLMLADMQTLGGRVYKIHRIYRREL